MGLPWIRLDTTIADHPKILELVEDKAFQAAFAAVMAMTYSGKHGTACARAASAPPMAAGSSTDGTSSSSATRPRRNGGRRRRRPRQSGGARNDRAKQCIEQCSEHMHPSNASSRCTYGRTVLTKMIGYVENSSHLSNACARVQKFPSNVDGSHGHVAASRDRQENTNTVIHRLGEK